MGHFSMEISANPGSVPRGNQHAIHHAADMADVVNTMIYDLFSKRPKDGVYRVNDDEGHRLMFIAGLAVNMARRVEDAYRVAHKNYASGKGGAS